MKMFKIVCGALALVPAAWAGDLGAWLSEEGSLWNLTADRFMADHAGEGFRWVSGDESLARSAGGGIEFLGLKVLEASVRFDQAKPAGAALFLYSRGDVGDMDRKAFSELVAEARTRISRATGVEPRRIDDQMTSIGVKRDGAVWNKPPSEVRLVWAYSTKDAGGSFAYQSEYARVELRPSAGAGMAPRPTVSVAELRSRVQRRPGGDVVLAGVPMVDQGERGYCAVAAAERVMRYYGLAVDQHELAQLAASSSGEGTAPRQMIDALKRTGSKLGCKIRVFEDWDVDSFQRLTEQYNRVARKRDLPAIQLDRDIDVSDVCGRMDFEVLREVRARDAGGLKKWVSTLTAQLDQGLPLVWSVVLGKVPEVPPVEGSGGHMRLLIGINQRTSEVLYSDTWGAGHEEKRMDLADAWAITQGLYLIEPRWTTR